MLPFLLWGDILSNISGNLNGQDQNELDFIDILTIFDTIIQIMDYIETKDYNEQQEKTILSHMKVIGKEFDNINARLDKIETLLRKE